VRAARDRELSNLCQLLRLDVRERVCVREKDRERVCKRGETERVSEGERECERERAHAIADCPIAASFFA
jgi:hypothetical protein